jgi:sodium/hydrogen exchanger-like protein 3
MCLNISLCQSKFLRFKRSDNRFIHSYLLRNYQGAEPKILETYSKLAMKDSMEYMRRNTYTVGNISGTESMSSVFHNYTTGNINGNLSGTLNGRLFVLHGTVA